MHRLRNAAVLAAASVALAVPAGSRAQPAPPAAAAAPVPDYHPSFGDLMTMAVQPRHIKVGVAGKARNWTYVTYESSELRNAFGRIARTIPAYRGSKLADLFAAGITPQLDEMDAAIKAKDGKAFDAAYGHLTQACNACHAALEHAYVVVQEPQGSPYADQDFKAH